MSQTDRAMLLGGLLFIGFLYDSMGFLRMALLCGFLHEAGHVLVFLLCTGRWPKLCLGFGGIALSGAQALGRKQELAVLCAGPAVNFLFAAVLYGIAQQRASYGVYFLGAVSFCTGAYNLLPLEVLDGGRILQNLAAGRHTSLAVRLQRWVLFLFCLVCAAAGCCSALEWRARIAALLAAAYIAVQEWGPKRSFRY